MFLRRDSLKEYARFYSIITPNVDLYAHLGGFIGGFLVTTMFVMFRRS